MDNPNFILVMIGLVAFISLAAAEEADVRGKMKRFEKPADSELKQKLTPEQYKVTQHEATERPFANAFWDNKQPGIYVDVVSGEPLFSSTDKFDSGTGWPSFTKPLDGENVVYKTDRKLLYSRTEVRSKSGDSHLGHLFSDGPEPTGQRYCMNSAALRFVPAERLKVAGYPEYQQLFPGIVQVEESGAESSGNGSALQSSTVQKAVLAGGCFWGMEDLFRTLPGVVETRVGYTGGSVADPNYSVVSSGRSGHAESIEVSFDTGKLLYEDLLRFFFRIHDPTTLNQQGNDRGSQYRSTIFFLDAQQRAAAEKIKAEVDRSGKWKRPVVTEIVEASAFYEAEDYHQDYLVKNPGGYSCHFVRD